MAISMKLVEEYLWPHFAPLWRDKFKALGFDADKWDDATLKQAVKLYGEVHRETCQFGCKDSVDKLPIKS